MANDNKFVLFLFLQLCEGGSVMDMVRGMVMSDKRMKEEHIAFILREVVKVSQTISLSKVKKGTTFFY